MTTTRSIVLQTGTLHVNVDDASEGLDEYVEFACRSNPKRGFLFVSKVLGRHLPTLPSTIKKAQGKLAKKISACITDGPVLFVGLAETAVGMAHGIYEEYLTTATTPAAFIHSTRSPIPNKKLCASFEESHSHAASHWIHNPEEMQPLIQNLKTLVIVDDEQSTGQTAVALALNLVQGLSTQPDTVIIASYCDWINTEQRVKAEKELYTKFQHVHWVSFVRGSWSFDKNTEFKAELPSPPDIPAQYVPMHTALGRLGRMTAIEDLKICNTSMTAWVTQWLSENTHCNKDILVLGTGECAYAPFLLAEYLERHASKPCYFQAITRSPILLGNSIQRSREVPSPCGQSVRYYLHNGQPEECRTLVCFETKEAALNWVAPFSCEKVWFDV